jgi:serine/threonine-protein kinase
VTDPISRLNEALEGRYRIERQLGEGGMATVYLADDLRHGRKVALKVLKPELAAVIGAERFLAEIKTTANLQHPHILPLFDSGEADTFLFYVMPYVEGETLREKIDRERQLPVAEAVRIATKVAGALQAAHERGVIHRDIKPANILLSNGEPLVSDFGIALAVTAGGAGRLTETGLSLGTPHYMSPEQATGDLSVGAATDTYALGCVLYEMLVGEPPYTGSTPQAVLGKIVTGDADPVTKHRRTVPPNVDGAIRSALEKVPADRFGSASDFARALADPGFRHGAVAGGVGATSAGPWKRLAIAATSFAAVFALVAAWSLVSREPPPPVSRYVLSTEGLAGANVRMGLFMAVAPDGSSMVLPVEAAGGLQLGLKMRGSTEITPIPGTEGASNVAYSPDAQSIVYRIGSDLFRRPIAGGSAARVADDAEAGTIETPVAVAWLDDGTLLYERQAGELVQIPENGGEPRVVFQPNAQTSWVRGLPGARGALVGTGTTASVLLLDLRNLSSAVLLEETQSAWYAPSGHLVLVRYDGAVSAQRFDLGALENVGGETPLFSGVRVVTTTGTVADMQLAADGTVLYMEGGSGLRGTRELVLVDRMGGEESLGFEPGNYVSPRFSPEGRRLAVQLPVGTGTDADLWVLDLDRGSRSRVTFDGDNRFPSWTPQGDRLTFGTCCGEPNVLVSAAADGSGQMDTLVTEGTLKLPTSWSRDGTALFYDQLGPGTARDLWVLREGQPEPILGTRFMERNGAISPDGRWLAYESDRSGRFEIYVRPYPGPGPEGTVSTQGGREPVWAPNGSQIFFRSEGRLMTVPVDLTNGFRADAPRVLFEGAYFDQGGGAPNYDVAPDGEHFVFVRAVGEDGGGVGARLILVENFLEELRGLAGN